MADGAPSAMGLMKEFFGLSNAELIEFKKSDPDGFELIKMGLVNGTLTY